jgi:hypothetical protein
MAECFGVLVVCVVLGFLAWVGIRGDVSHGYTLRALRLLENRYRGRIQRDGFWGPSRLTFYDDGAAVCEFVNRNGRMFFEVRLGCGDVPTLGKISSLPRVGARIISEPGYAFFTRFRDGDSHEHVLFHQDVNDGYRLLSDGVRQQVGLLRQTPFLSNIEVELHAGRLIVRKQWASVVPENAVRYLEQALAFRDQLLLSNSGQISFMEDSAPIAIGEATCRVCGEAVTEPVVICTRCKTPHHLDCWQYSQGCSVYACGGKEYVAAKRENVN